MPTFNNFKAALSRRVAGTPHRLEEYSHTISEESGESKKGTRSYVQYAPLANEKGNLQGIYVHYGRTGKRARGTGIGTEQRKIGRNAAHNLQLTLYQVSQNLEKLVPGQTPISGKIMKKLGAVPASEIPGHPSKSKEPYKFKIPPPSPKRLSYGKRASTQ